MINYDPHKWLDHFFDYRGTLLKEIGGRVLGCVAWSVVVVCVHFFWFKVGISAQLHSLVGVALGLLLVFRTNASYDRYWEGRKLWGGIVNETRNLARLASLHLGADAELLARFIRWTGLFPWAVMNVLRGEQSLGPYAADVGEEAAANAAASQHPALAVASEMTACLVQARNKGLVSDIVLASIDQNIQLLVGYLGGCERIRRTPLPFAYVVHLRRSLVVFCFSLPFALVETFGWATILDVLVVAYIYFGIEEIGVEIEGPFGYDENDLPLESICETIHGNIYSLAGIERSVRETLPEGL